MDWIWSYRFLKLSCTSTHSSYLKWVSGGGINSPSLQTSRWLTATEKGSVGWTDARFSRASVHLVPLPRHIAVEILSHNCSVAMHRWSVGSSAAEDPATKSSLLASTRPSDRPTLPLYHGVGSSGAEGFVLARLYLFKTNCRIDWRCPHSDRRIIWCYYLRCSSSATCPTHLEIGPSVHPTVPRVSTSVPTRPTIAPTLAIWVPSVHPTVSFPSFSSRLQLGSLLQLNILNMPLLIPFKYVLSPQICCK
jgi:hypothetical protein